MSPHELGIGSVLDLMSLPASDFVGASYRLMLGRPPSPLELEERSGVVRAGLGRARFLADIGRSAEFRQHQDRWLREGDNRTFVESLFLRYLGRRPDQKGLNHYTGLLASGRDRQRLLKDISQSSEARVRWTLWYELERILIDDSAERHWIRRWIGRARRRERHRNRELEIIVQRNVALPSIGGHMTSSSEVPVATRFVGDIQNMGRDARRLLSRMRYSAGVP